VRLTYDSDRDLLSIRLGDKVVSGNRAVSPHVALDFDAAGTAVTIQVARASEFVDLSSLDAAGLPIPEAPDAGRHIVRPGDTLGAIAAASGTTVEALVAANNLEDPDLISVGQSLSLPTR
jgi:LysM repeat protein